MSGLIDHDLDAWRVAVARIVVPDNAPFHIALDVRRRIGEIAVVATMTVPDANGGGESIVSRMEPAPWRSPVGIPMREVAWWIRQFVIVPLIEHELDEWIYVDGTREFNPHDPARALVPGRGL